MVEEEEEDITTHHEIHQLLNMNQVEDGVVVEDMYREEVDDMIRAVEEDQVVEAVDIWEEDDHQ